MATYKVENRDSYYYVIGLSDWRGNPNTMLIYQYPSGDADSPHNAELMLGALYDLYQTRDSLKEGDRFETPFGNFVCVDVHVVPEGGAPGVHAPRGRYRPTTGTRAALDRLVQRGIITPPRGGSARRLTSRAQLRELADTLGRASSTLASEQIIADREPFTACDPGSDTYHNGPINKRGVCESCGCWVTSFPRDTVCPDHQVFWQKCGCLRKS